MSESPQVPSPDPRTMRVCTDCGQQFEVTNVRGIIPNCCDACHRKRMDFTHTSNPEVEAPPDEARPWYRSPAVWITVLVLAGVATAGVIWRKPILSQYRSWSQERHASRAAENFAKGDYQRTILDGRSALQLNPWDIETNRLVARAAEALGSPDAVAWRARLNVIDPGDPENVIAWAKGALKVGDVEAAEDAIHALKPAARKGADYHAIAGDIAMARKDGEKAEFHWTEALKLNPRSDDYRLKLASLQIKSRSATGRAAAAATLESLGAKSGSELAALRALIEDAMNHQEFARARELADRLVANPDANFVDRIGRLSVLRGADAPDAPAYLEQLRDESLTDPEQLTTLLNWMNQNGLPLLVSDWAPGLQPSLASQPPVCLAIAEAFSKGREWKKLKAFTDAGPWKDFEHVRLAYQARVLDNSGAEVAAKATWERALVETENKAGRLTAIARLAQTWHWDERAESALRKLSADESTPLWVLDALWVMARKSGNSEDLHNLSRLIVKARPKNPTARNNFIWLSILRHSDEGAIHSLAAELHKEYPDDITIATTYGLSLFEQGKVFDALGVLEKFPPERLREPGVAIYYGIFLQVAGNADKAAEYLALTDGTPLLRDEAELIGKVKRDSRLNTLVPRPKASITPAQK